MMELARVTTPEFSESDIHDYRLLEGRIVDGFRQFARSFVEIRDRRLYLIDGYPSFDEYCKKRWDFNGGRRYVDQVIVAAKICDSFEQIGTERAIALGETPSSVVVPVTEYQSRALQAVPGSDEQKKDVWDKALEKAGGVAQNVTHQAILDELRAMMASKMEAIPEGSIVRVSGGGTIFEGKAGTLVKYVGNSGSVAKVDLTPRGYPSRTIVDIPSQYLQLVSLPEPQPEPPPEQPKASAEERLEVAIALIKLALPHVDDGLKANMFDFLEGEAANGLT